MNLENPYCCFEGALPSRICDDLVTYGEQQAAQVALTGEYDNVKLDTEKDISKLYKTRNSSIVWMNEPWIYNSIIPFVNLANTLSNWNFEWSMSEPCQWTKYAETQHYHWHQDSFPKPFDKPQEKNYGLIRKLSVTVSLADGNDYEGGDLEFDLRNKIVNSKVARTKGSIIVFPSFVWHRVSPVTKGIRYSLVIWNCGKPFV